jgi:hypothetical protein
MLLHFLADSVSTYPDRHPESGTKRLTEIWTSLPCPPKIVHFLCHNKFELCPGYGGEAENSFFHRASNNNLRKKMAVKTERFGEFHLGASTNASIVWCFSPNAMGLIVGICNPSLTGCKLPRA